MTSPSGKLPVLFSSRWSPGMRAALVFSMVMGICIIASLVYVLSQIMHRLDDKAQANVETVAPQQVSKFSGIELPAGAQIMQLVPNGAQLIIWARVPQEGERLIMVDTHHAQVTGEMRVTYSGKK